MLQPEIIPVLKDNILRKFCSLSCMICCCYLFQSAQAPKGSTERKHRNLRCILVRVGTGCIRTGAILELVLGTQPYSKSHTLIHSLNGCGYGIFKTGLTSYSVNKLYCFEEQKKFTPGKHNHLQQYFFLHCNLV